MDQGELFEAGSPVDTGPDEHVAIIPFGDLSSVSLNPGIDLATTVNHINFKS